MDSAYWQRIEHLRMTLPTEAIAGIYVVVAALLVAFVLQWRAAKGSSDKLSRLQAFRYIHGWLEEHRNDGTLSSREVEEAEVFINTKAAEFGLCPYPHRKGEQ